MGKALLEKPPGREDSASSADGRRGKDTNGMKSILDDLLGEFSDDLECTSNEVLEDMRKYEKVCEPRARTVWFASRRS